MMLCGKFLDHREGQTQHDVVMACTRHLTCRCHTTRHRHPDSMT